jgi:hypothetical protein
VSCSTVVDIMYLIRILRHVSICVLLIAPTASAQALPLTRPSRPPRGGNGAPPASSNFNIATKALSGAIQGQDYSAALALAEGIPPYTFSVSSGTLPPNVTLNAATGVISGIPGGAGTFSFTIFASDLAGRTATKSFSIIVSPSGENYGNGGDAYATEGAIPDPAATVLMTCQGNTPLEANKSYRLGQNLNAASPSDRCLTLNTGVKLDLAGFTVAGSIKMNGDPNGLRVFNGTINCSVIDTGNVPGCLSLAAFSAVTTAPRLHHLTITNTGNGTRAIHIDWPMPAKQSTISIRLYNLTIVVPAQPSVPRSYAVSFQGLNQTPEFFNNDLTCSAQAAACQAIMCFQAGDCKVHHNRVNLVHNTTAADTGRGILFDGGTMDGEAWNNLILANNNRGIRIRASFNVRIHSNKFLNIEDNGTGAIHLADPASTDTDNLNALIDNNDFELAGGNVVFIRNGINATVRNNRFTCAGSFCNSSRLAYVRSPLTPGSTQSILTVENNSNVILYAAPAQNRVDAGGVLNICNSGQAGGVGTVNPTTCP